MICALHVSSLVMLVRIPGVCENILREVVCSFA
jgi:hypothetical protein